MNQQYVAIDLHRWRSVIVREDEAGNELEVQRIDNDPFNLSQALAAAGDAPEVAIEATYGWYWAVDQLLADGARVHLVNPSGLDWGERRVKNDVKDCRSLLTMLRLGKLPEAWIAPPDTRELRELVRYRFKLVCLRSSLKAQVQAVLAKHGMRSPVHDLWGVGGTRFLNDLDLPHAYAVRVSSLRALIGAFDAEVAVMEHEIAKILEDHRGYRAILEIHGVGPTLAAIFVAEIGDVGRFDNPKQLCSWAGLTPKHRESDTKVHRGHITKAGSPLVRWAAVEAISKNHGTAKLAEDKRRIGERRTKNIARVAVARKLLTLVYWGLRDGHIRCLDAHGEAA